MQECGAAPWAAPRLQAPSCWPLGCLGSAAGLCKPLAVIMDTRVWNNTFSCCRVTLMTSSQCPGQHPSGQAGHWGRARPHHHNPPWGGLQGTGTGLPLASVGEQEAPKRLCQEHQLGGSLHPPAQRCEGARTMSHTGTGCRTAGSCRGE